MTSRSNLAANFLSQINRKSSEDESDAAERTALKLNLSLIEGESNSVRSNTALFQSVINKNEAYPERDRWLDEGRKHRT